jgi:nucleoside-diphosphate-sugar epimerase
MVTGGGGLVGRFIVAEGRARGFDVVAPAGWRLGDTLPLEGVDLLVHAAFAHVPGKYRGGEGDDPAGFVRANLDGTVAMFRRAARDGVGRVVFLSSRAVYDGLDAEVLTEEMAVAPDSLYGQVKLAGEQALAAECRGASLRATGVYGPGAGHKWMSLFADFVEGRAIAPRRATEVAGQDVAAAVFLPLEGVFNVSDLLLDRRDLLAEVARLTGCAHPLPARSEERVAVMATDRLRAAGWVPGGMARLRALLPEMITQA